APDSFLDRPPLSIVVPCKVVDPGALGHRNPLDLSSFVASCPSVSSIGTHRPKCYATSFPSWTSRVRTPPPALDINPFAASSNAYPPAVGGAARRPSQVSSLLTSRRRLTPCPAHPASPRTVFTRPPGRPSSSSTDGPTTWAPGTAPRVAPSTTGSSPN